jgi:hypothetical protein
MTPALVVDSRTRVSLETQLENIISAVALMADSDSTRPNRRDRLVDECNSLRQALQDLLNVHTMNVGGVRFTFQSLHLFTAYVLFSFYLFVGLIQAKPS